MDLSSRWEIWIITNIKEYSARLRIHNWFFRAELEFFW